MGSDEIPSSPSSDDPPTSTSPPSTQEILRQEVDMEIDVDNIEEKPILTSGAKTSTAAVDEEQKQQQQPTTDSPPTNCDITATSSSDNNVIVAETSTNDDTLGNSNSSSNQSSINLENVIQSKQASEEAKAPAEEEQQSQYNEFLYWRPPLPDIDVTLDKKDSTDSIKTNSSDDSIKSNDEVDAVTSSSSSSTNSSNSAEEESPDKKSSLSEIENELTEAVSELEKCLLSEGEQAKKNGDEKEGTSVDPQAASTENKDVQLLSAAVVTVTDDDTNEEEEVANFGSMHVLGQQVDQKTMAIVDGVVQGSSNNHKPAHSKQLHITRPSNSLLGRGTRATNFSITTQPVLCSIERLCLCFCVHCALWHNLVINWAVTICTNSLLVLFGFDLRPSPPLLTDC